MKNVMTKSGVELRVEDNIIYTTDSKAFWRSGNMLVGNGRYQFFGRTAFVEKFRDIKHYRPVNNAVFTCLAPMKPARRNYGNTAFADYDFPAADPRGH